jgi:hypothetical protein
MDKATRRALIALIDEYAEHRERAYAALQTGRPHKHHADDADRLSQVIVDKLDKL